MQIQDTAPIRDVNTSDRFSFKRAQMVARYYFPTFRTQLWLYPLVGFIFGLLYHVQDYFSLLGVFYMLLSLTVGFMIYWAPIVMTSKQRTTDILLPAKWSEKALVLLVYFYVVVPIIVNLSTYLGAGIVSLIRFGEIRIISDQTVTVLSKLATSEWMYYLLSYTNMILPISIFLFIVCRSAKPKAWQGILWSVVSTFSIGIAVGVFIVAKVFSMTKNLSSEFLCQEEAEEFVMKSLDFQLMLGVVSSILVVGTLLFTLLSVRAIRRVQA